jgi:hypothetical protein
MQIDRDWEEGEVGSHNIAHETAILLNLLIRKFTGDRKT